MIINGRRQSSNVIDLRNTTNINVAWVTKEVANLYFINHYSVKGAPGGLLIARDGSYSLTEKNIDGEGEGKLTRFLNSTETFILLEHEGTKVSRVLSDGQRIALLTLAGYFKNKLTDTAVVCPDGDLKEFMQAAIRNK